MIHFIREKQARAILTVALFILTRVDAQEEIVGEGSDADLKIRGVFDSNLPNTERKNALKMVLHPHFGDLHRHHYLRIPMGLRYGMSDRWELSAEGETYFAHGLKSKSIGSEIGFSGFALVRNTTAISFVVPTGTRQLALTTRFRWALLHLS